MAHVIITKVAQQDLRSIRAYIQDELGNPDAAQRIIAELKKSIQSLQYFPGRGRPLDALIALHTEYRYLVCENYCIFYLGDENDVAVVRILHQRQDCLRALLIKR